MQRLAQGHAYPSVRWLGEMMLFMDNMYPIYRPKVRCLRTPLTRKLGVGGLSQRNAI